jgi:hypothetical protein
MGLINCFRNVLISVPLRNNKKLKCLRLYPIVPMGPSPYCAVTSELCSWWKDWLKISISAWIEVPPIVESVWLMFWIPRVKIKGVNLIVSSFEFNCYASLWGLNRSVTDTTMNLTPTFCCGDVTHNLTKFGSLTLSFVSSAYAPPYPFWKPAIIIDLQETACLPEHQKAIRDIQVATYNIPARTVG